MKWMYRFAPLVGAALLAGAAAVPAFASGPGGGQGNGNGSTGRQQVTLFCSNEQQYTVSVPAADGAMGVGQIVDAQVIGQHQHDVRLGRFRCHDSSGGQQDNDR